MFHKSATASDASHLQDRVQAPSAVFHDLRVPSRKGQEIGLLQLEILQAFGLPKLDQFGETDAYCFAVCGAYAFRTSVIPDVSNPTWDAHTARRACIFPLFQAYARLYVGVFDDDGDADRDDFAGRVVIDVAPLRPNSLYDVTLPLRQSAHVYSTRPRGAIRLRFKVQYYQERNMVLSYLPQLPLKVPTEPDTSVTVRCCDRKAFQNIALTVHGTHMPGRFSMKMLKALIREVTFTQAHILRYLRKREMQNLVEWKYPFISTFVFCAWMHGVYANTVGYVPGHVVAFLLLHLWKNYAAYGMEGALHAGFVPPSWEELLAALLWGRGNENTKDSSKDNALTTTTKSASVKNYKNKGRVFIQPLELSALPKQSSPMELIRGPMASSSALPDAPSMREDNGETSELQLPSTTVSSSSSTNKNTADIYQVAEDFMRGVETKRRRDRVTFTGAQAVEFLVTAGYATTRQEAVDLAEQLQHKLQLFENSQGARKHAVFRDDPDVRYHFVPFARPEFLSKTHTPWGKFLFRILGFAPQETSYEKDQMNFPFGGGTDHPRFTVQQSLCLRASEKKEKRRLLKALSLGSSEDLGGGGGGTLDLSKGLDLSSDDDSVGDDNNVDQNDGYSSDESGDGLATMSTSSSLGEINTELGDKPGFTVIKLKPPTNQDIDFKTKADKPIGEVMDNVRDLVHKNMLHAFNVQTYVVKGKAEKDMSLSKPKRPRLSRIRNVIRGTKRFNKKTSSRGELAVQSAHSRLTQRTEKEESNANDLPSTSAHSQLSASSFHDESNHVRQPSMDSMDDLPLSEVSTTNMAMMENVKVEYDKLLKTGTNSNSNPWVSKVGVLVQPMIEAALGVLGMIRAVYNIFTWRDPILSFWVSLVGPVIVVFFYICPWRIILGAVGVVVLGPQNWVLRLLRERRGEAPKDPDVVIKRIKPPKAQEIVQQEPLFSSKAHENEYIDYSSLRDDDVRHVVVPHTQLLFNHRFYDWPPEPQFSDVKPDPTPIGVMDDVVEIGPAASSDRGVEDATENKQRKRWFGRKKKKDD